MSEYLGKYTGDNVSIMTKSGKIYNGYVQYVCTPDETEENEQLVCLLRDEAPREIGILEGEIAQIVTQSDIISFKVLAYLYSRLKGRTHERPSFYIQPKTTDFPVVQSYLDYVLKNLLNKGLIEHLDIMKVWGGDPIVKVTDQLRITPDGIHYLRDNSTMRKLSQLLPQAAAIASLFEEI